MAPLGGRVRCKGGRAFAGFSCGRGTHCRVLGVTVTVAACTSAYPVSVMCAMHAAENVCARPSWRRWGMRRDSAFWYGRPGGAQKPKSMQKGDVCGVEMCSLNTARTVRQCEPRWADGDTTMQMHRHDQDHDPCASIFDRLRAVVRVRSARRNRAPARPRGANLFKYRKVSHSHAHSALLLTTFFATLWLTWDGCEFTHYRAPVTGPPVPLPVHRGPRYATAAGGPPVARYRPTLATRRSTRDGGSCIVALCRFTTCSSPRWPGMCRFGRLRVL